MTEEHGINQLKRRDFLKAGLVFGAGAAGLAAGYAAVPDAFARAVYAAKQEGITNDKILVMVQLAGGNDGLRTVVPLQDPKLHDYRPRLAGPSVVQALPLTADYGLNQNLKGVKRLFDAGRVAIVQGVGYPNPVFSHFESIRIWETGDPTRRSINGWLGQLAAKQYDTLGHPLTGCACGATDVPGALRDLQATMTVIQDPKNFGFTGVKLLHVTLGGFDTHYTELNRHDDLMGYFDQAVSAFFQDLDAHGMASNVLLATWSEFGRRPKENASGGTDHGAASPLLLIGSPVKGGFYGAAPRLDDLDATGNLKYKVDFRSVYQEILSAHLGADAKAVLGDTFEQIPFIAAPVSVSA